MFAIERALDEARHGAATMHVATPVQHMTVDGGRVALIDEPERALHAAGERKMAHAVSSLGQRVLVSTHSTEFLDAASQGQGTVQLVERTPDGFARVAATSLSLDPAIRDDVAARWGMSPARVAALTGVFIFVEGPHDKIIINALLEHELEQCRAVVQTLGGTKDLHLLAISDLVFASSDAPVIVCVDNAELPVLTACMHELRLHSAVHRRAAHLAGASNRFRTPEMQSVLSLLRAAVQRGRDDRIHPFGFSKRDIVEYLPVELIHPNYTSWRQLDRAFLDSTNRTRFAAGDAIEKKRWINASGGKLSVVGIERALRRLRADPQRPVSRHADFDVLADMMKTLVRR
jgi:hypothetical protein